MKKITNSNKVRLRYFIATVFTVTGIAMVVASVFLGNLTDNPVSSVFSSFFAIILMIIGVKATNQWVRQPTSLDSIESGLKGLGKGALLLSYHLPSEHILICKYGIFSLIPIHQKSNMKIDKTEWSDQTNLLSQLKQTFTEGSAGNLPKKVHKDTLKSEAWLKEQLPEVDIPEIQPIIVFTHPNSKLHIIAQAIPPVGYTKKGKYTLKNLLNTHQTTTLTPENIKKIIKVFEKN